MALLPKIKQKTYGLLAVLTLAAPLLATGSAAAGTSASFGLSSGGTFTVGDAFSVTVTVNPGAEQVNGAEADVSYDAAALKLVSVDSGTSAFDYGAPTVSSAGLIKLARVRTSDPLSGSGTFAALNFQVLAPAASSAVSVTGSSAIANGSTDVWNHQVVSSNFAFKAKPTPVASSPAPAAPTTQNPAAPNSGGSSTSSGGSSTGSTPKNQSTTSPAPSGAAPSSGTNPAPSVQPQVVPESASQTTTVLEETGYLMAITVVDGTGKAVEGATVVLDNGQTVKTDSKGTAGFINVPVGSHKVSVAYSGKKTTQTVTVEKPAANKQTAPQEFKVKLASSRAQPSGIVYAALAIVAVVAVGLLLPRRSKLVVNRINPETQEAIVVNGQHNQTPSTTPVTPATTVPPAPVAEDHHDDGPTIIKPQV